MRVIVRKLEVLVRWDGGNKYDCSFLVGGR